MYIVQCFKMIYYWRAWTSFIIFNWAPLSTSKLYVLYLCMDSLCQCTAMSFTISENILQSLQNLAKCPVSLQNWKIILSVTVGCLLCITRLWHVRNPLFHDRLLWRLHTKAFFSIPSTIFHSVAGLIAPLTYTTDGQFLIAWLAMPQNTHDSVTITLFLHAM